MEKEKFAQYEENIKTNSTEEKCICSHCDTGFIDKKLINSVVLEKIRGVYLYSILLLTIANIILSFFSFGERRWYDISFNTYGIVYNETPGVYCATILDASTIGTIFFVLCCLLLLLCIIVLCLKLNNKKEIKMMNNIFCGLTLATGILGIITQASESEFIIKHIEMTEWSGQNADYVKSCFTNQWILYLILLFSIIMFTYSIVEIVLRLITKNIMVINNK